MRLRKYHTRLLLQKEECGPSFPCKSSGWAISLEPEVLEKAYVKRGNFREVVIHAVSLLRAQEVADLVYAAMSLDSAEQPQFGRIEVLPADPEETKQLDEMTRVARRERTAQFSGIPRACLIATKASRRRAWQNALHKYSLSLYIMPIDSRSIDPTRWQPGPAVTSAAGYHVSCAYAIISAYSVLEEISLEMRASPQKPSMIKGKKNPIVWEDLEARLKASRVDITNTIPWLLRGTPTRIEQRSSIGMSKKVSWAYGEIRDREIDLVDAINHASWLRSKVSSHRLKMETRSLTHYDVSNVQHLARRLLLEKLGFWSKLISSKS